MLRWFLYILAALVTLLVAGFVWLVSFPVDCLEPGERREFSYEVAGKLHEESLVVGEDWGFLESNQGDYACMGLCGPGCENKENGVWLYHCMVHDACSYRYSSKNFMEDPNCGESAYLAARENAARYFKGCPTD